MTYLGKETKKRAEDDYQWVAVNNFPKGVYNQYRSCGDNIASGSVLGGVDFQIDESTAGNYDLYWQFLNITYMKGGVCAVEGTVHKDDKISFGIVAPATTGTSNPGAGSFDKSIVGAGKYRFQPVESGGDWDLNVTEKLNANVAFTKAVPYPNPYGQGFFDFNPATGVITPNLGGSGKYDIYDHVKEVGTFVLRIAAEPALDLLGPDIVATPILPHYLYRVRYERVGTSAFTVRWHLVLGLYDIRTDLWGDA